jgi:hypothetical protein
MLRIRDYINYDGCRIANLKEVLTNLRHVAARSNAAWAGLTVTSNGNDTAEMDYHRRRARAERLAATRAGDDRASRAHLELARQHEIAMCQSRTLRHAEDDVRQHMIGATLRAVMALPDAPTGGNLPLEAPSG